MTDPVVVAAPTPAPSLAAKVVAFFSKHRKAVVAAVGAVVLVIGEVVGVASPVYVAITGVASALGVYTAPNAA